MHTCRSDVQVHVDGMTSSDGDSSDSWNQLLRLALAADVVITEDMPVIPHTGWLLDLKKVLPDRTALWAVDTACIMPMLQVNKLHVRAYTYRCGIHNNVITISIYNIGMHPQHGDACCNIDNNIS